MNGLVLSLKLLGILVVGYIVLIMVLNGLAKLTRPKYEDQFDEEYEDNI